MPAGRHPERVLKDIQPKGDIVGASSSTLVSTFSAGGVPVLYNTNNYSSFNFTRVV